MWPVVALLGGCSTGVSIDEEAASGAVTRIVYTSRGEGEIEPCG